MKTLRRLFCVAVVCLLSCFVFPFYGILAKAYVTIEAEIPVYCLEVTDNRTHVYQIKIESENNISPAPKSDILEITEDGTGKFQIDIDEPGTFMYRVYEQPGNDPNVIYDTNVYSVKIFVETNTKDVLNYAVVAEIIGKDGKPDSIKFLNMVESTPDESDGGTHTTVVTTVPNTTSQLEITTTASTDNDNSQATATITTVTTSESDNTKRMITEFVDSVLTGDSFSAHAVRTVMLSSIIIAILTLLFKRDKDEEEETNEE